MMLSGYLTELRLRQSRDGANGCSSVKGDTEMLNMIKIWQGEITELIIGCRHLRKHLYNLTFAEIKLSG